MKTNDIEKESAENDEQFGMANVGEPKKYVPNKVTEVEDLENVVEIN